MQDSPSNSTSFLLISVDDRTVNHTFEKVRSFHSSLCLCDLGTKGAVLCSSKSCGICQIVKSRFKSFAFGALSNTGRWVVDCILGRIELTRPIISFGDGIYSYRNPALADVFATSCTSSPYRVMIVCDVVVEPRQTKVDKVRHLTTSSILQQKLKPLPSSQRKSHSSFQQLTRFCQYTSSCITSGTRANCDRIYIRCSQEWEQFFLLGCKSSNKCCLEKSLSGILYGEIQKIVVTSSSTNCC